MDRTIKRFEQLDTMTNRSILGRPASVTNEKKQLDVAVSFIQNPHLSLRKHSSHKASQQHNIDHKSVYMLIKFHLYKVKLVQKLNDNDPDRCLEFCDLMMERN